MIDNFDKIRPNLHFTGDVLYHVQIIQRSKDGHTTNTRTIVDFYVHNAAYFEFITSAIKTLCNSYNARAYINLNPKSEESILWKMMDSGMERLKNKQPKPLSLLPHSVSSVNGFGRKVWIVDVDDSNVHLDDIIYDINKCKSGQQTNAIDVFPTVNGYHILTHPFDLTDLSLKLEIKKNSPTLLYYN